jgi:hypothetical protein
MTPPLPKTTNRLARAAIAEREALQRHRAKLADQRDAVLAKVEDLEAGLHALDERISVLDGLARAHESENDAREELPATRPALSGATDGSALLRGPSIRTTAVRVLSSHVEGRGAVHYRRWFDLLTQAGYEVAGKDPLAVFLTQVSRSPLIRRTTRAGFYELNRGAVEDLRGRLRRLHVEFSSLTAASADAATLVQARRRRDELLAEIGKTERALQEALDVLDEEDTGPSRFAAAG